jgi:hypothetical protein
MIVLWMEFNVKKKVFYESITNIYLSTSLRNITGKPRAIVTMEIPGSVKQRTHGFAR